jgi:hypothetical protein
MVQLIKLEINSHRCLIYYHGMYKLRDKDNQNITLIIIIKFRMVDKQMIEFKIHQTTNQIILIIKLKIQVQKPT